MAVYAGDDDNADSGHLLALQRPEFEARRRSPQSCQPHLDVNDIIMDEGSFEIALDMNAREYIAAIERVGDADRTQELDLGDFEIPKHRGVMDSSAGICIDESDAGLKTESFSLNHSHQQRLRRNRLRSNLNCERGSTPLREERTAGGSPAHSAAKHDK